jgi:hypothetical protein
VQSVKFVSRSICCCLFPPCEQNAYLAMDSWQCVLRVFRTYTTWFFDISLPFSLFRSLQRPKPRDQKRLARSLPVFFFRDWVVAVLFEVNSISYCMIFVSFRGRWFRAFPARKWAALARGAPTSGTAWSGHDICHASALVPCLIFVLSGLQSGWNKPIGQAQGAFRYWQVCLV